MSLPSSMADFVPCDRLLQKAYHNQFLLSIVSYSFYLFVEFAEVLILKGKSDGYK